jgi:hypothetical protein
MDIKIQDGIITLELTVNDAALLAKACAIAEEHTVMQADVHDKIAFKAWTVAFTAMTIAAVGHYNMLERHKEKASAFAEQLLGVESEVPQD